MEITSARELLPEYSPGSGAIVADLLQQIATNFRERERENSQQNFSTKYQFSSSGSALFSILHILIANAIYYSISDPLGPATSLLGLPRFTVK